MKNKILVIAYKFNDIYYAINTKEFKASTDRNLVIFIAGDLAKENFPFLNLFNSVKVIAYPHSVFFLPIILYQLSRIVSLLNKDEPLIFLSNIEIIVNQYLISRFPASSVILLEDGVMNYYYDKKTDHKDPFLKKLALYILGVEKHIARLRTQITYLHLPSEAVYYYGEKKHLELQLDVKVDDSLIRMLEGKSVLIGGGYLEAMPIEKRIQYVRQAIDKFDIDFFIPHHYSKQGLYDSFEILDLQIYHITFEMLFTQMKVLRLYSFGSSVLLSASVINKGIEANFIEIVDLTHDLHRGMKFLKEKSTHTVSL